MPKERFYLAPHKNQTIALKITDELLTALEEADNLPDMDAFYREKYERGEFGNKYLLAHLRALRSYNETTINGTVIEPVEAEERWAADGTRVMVVSEHEDAIVWKGPWADEPRGAYLAPSDFELVEVELVEAPINV
jgi:hypothetical protein